VFLSRLHREGRRDAIRLPRTSLGAGGQPVALSDAAAFYESRARELARRFDLRDGTDRFARILAAAEQLATM
jgi:hypothetical protein